MKIFIAGTGSSQDIVESNPPLFLLESFYYIKKWQIPLIHQVKEFLLDSGAFTFINNSKKNINWIEYIEKYADFINKNNVDYFFELDIDSIVGYDKVLEYRGILEKLTNKQSIPVWHINRGIDEYKKMCSEYNYVALGGIVGAKKGDKKYKQYYSAFPALIKEAHKEGAKIHGLGFTSTSLFKKIRFDSVDSTTWITAKNCGNMAYFNGSGMRQYYPSLNGKKAIDTSKLLKHNYLEWLKFQKWAINNL